VVGATSSEGLLVARCFAAIDDSNGSRGAYRLPGCHRLHSGKFDKNMQRI